MPLTLLQTLASEAVLIEAYAWLCRQRKRWPDSADVWDFRRHWLTEKATLQRELRSGTYQIGLLSRTTLANGEDVDLWSARDALVMKALTLVLQPVLPLSVRCTHLKGHGGLKGTVRQVRAQLDSHPFVFKTDVQSYYASIDHHRLLTILAPHIPDPNILSLVGQYLKRRAERGGLVWEYPRGIALGCPLSPILGAFYLYEVDGQMARRGWWYVRYMDDVLVLAPTRWTLRQAVREVNQALGALGLEKARDKTFIGRIEKGFDFLGYHFSPQGLTVAQQTIDRFVARATRLYEQERERPDGPSRFGDYVSRWVRWTTAGIMANRSA